MRKRRSWKGWVIWDLRAHEPSCVRLGDREAQRAVDERNCTHPGRFELRQCGVTITESAPKRKARKNGKG